MIFTDTQIPAKPRNKRLRYSSNFSSIYGGSGGGGGGASITNYVRLTGSSEQIIDGVVGAVEDIIAYADSENPAIFELPVASSSQLGVVKVGSGLSINSEGVLSSSGGTGGGLSYVNVTGSGNVITSGATGTTNITGDTLILNKNFTAASTSDLNSHTGNNYIHVLSGEKGNWNYAVQMAHSHSNMSYLNVINQNLGTSYSPTFNNLYTNNNVISSGDVVAYSSSSSNLNLPVASTSQLGIIRVGNGLSINSDGVLSSSGGGTPLTLVTGGSGNAFTTASLNNNTLTLNKSINFATPYSAGSNVQISNNTISATDTRYSAGSGININSSNVISVTGGSGGGGGAINTVYYYGGTTSVVTNTYTSGLYIRSGYISTTGTISAGGLASFSMYNLGSNVLSVTANFKSFSTYTWRGYQLVCNVAWDATQSVYRFTLYNPTSASIDLSGSQIMYTAILA